MVDIKERKIIKAWDGGGVLFISRIEILGFCLSGLDPARKLTAFGGLYA